MKMFEREEELVEAFENKTAIFLEKILRKSVTRHFVLSEFDSYMGVADLIIGTYRPYLSRKTVRESVNLNWLIPLLNFEKGQTIYLDEFLSSYSLSNRIGQKQLQEYVLAGFLLKLAPRKFEVLQEYKFITDEVIAIEAKLRDWKKALLQANRYKRFSDFSFVLLDEVYASPALANLAVFENQNIGLVTMNKTNFKIHLFPQQKNLKKNEYFMRVNEEAYKYFTKTA